MPSRPLTTSDQTQARALWSLAFPGDSPAFMDWFFATQFPHLRSWSAWEKDRLLAVVYAMPYELICRSKPISAFFILGVATHPDARQQGVMRRLMYDVHNDLAEKCQAACLYPMAADFYQKIGYSFVSDHARLRLPVSALTSCEPCGHIASPPDFSRLAAINREHVRQMDFFARRGPTLLARRYADLRTGGGHCFLNENAYAFVESSPTQPALYLSEFSYTDITSGCSLLTAVARAHTSAMVRTFEHTPHIAFSLPLSDTPSQWTPVAERAPYLMLAGFDLPQLITGMRVAISSPPPQVIRVLDDASPHDASLHDALWRITCTAGTLSCSPHNPESPAEPVDATLTRDQLLRLVFGYSDAAALTGEGVSGAGILTLFPKTSAAFFDMY